MKVVKNTSGVAFTIQTMNRKVAIDEQLEVADSVFEQYKGYLTEVSFIYDYSTQPNSFADVLQSAFCCVADVHTISTPMISETLINNSEVISEVKELTNKRTKKTSGE